MSPVLDKADVTERSRAGDLRNHRQFCGCAPSVVLDGFSSFTETITNSYTRPPRLSSREVNYWLRMTTERKRQPSQGVCHCEAKDRWVYGWPRVRYCEQGPLVAQSPATNVRCPGVVYESRTLPSSFETPSVAPPRAKSAAGQCPLPSRDDDVQV
jgi:hypothetical protein